MKTKIYKQVFQKTGGFHFRITLPVAAFSAEELYPTAEDAALRCDLFKLYLVRKYSLSGNVFWPSLPPDKFSALLAEAGVDRTSPQSLFDALPQSCKDFLLDGGTEALTEYKANLATMQRVIS